jgi:hypothetical protein
VGGQNGIITGSVSYTSSFYGGLVFSGPTASVIFPTSSANFGTGSFTVELAFRPARIEGIHYLVSKNSGSFPNWGIYLSGSGGQGKLFSEFRISSTVSCSVSSSTTFVTGSVYQVDVRIAPASSASSIYVNGLPENLGLGNNGGSLTNTGSLFVGNFSQNNTQNFSGSIYTVKTYLQASLTQPLTNLNAISSRLGLRGVSTEPKVLELLVVGGGGGGGQSQAGGGGGGGILLRSINFTDLASGNSSVVVGTGGASSTNGQSSSFLTYVSTGGGYGGGSVTVANSGSSGGGGGGWINASTGSGTPGQGNPGGLGRGFGTDGFTNGSGGGGGAGETGRDYNDPQRPGQGGSGSYVASFAAIGGSPAGWFAGGGGGGYFSRIGGIGGGGAGGGENQNGQTGSINTGAGGGGGGNYSRPGGVGGSGIVAIRYSGGPIALGGEITQSAGFTYHVFRTVGTSSFTIF